MEEKKNKRLIIIFGIFALAIVTTVVSYAFFTYSRLGETTTTIISGDIEFSYIEGSSVEFSTPFPVSDATGATDPNNEYTFTVNMKSSSLANKMNYNVYFVSANDKTDVDYFNNEYIKFALLKNDVYVAGTNSTAGKKLSDIAGFTAGTSYGQGAVLNDQEITNGVTDTYKLRLWISDSADYSNTENGQDESSSFGKYNGYRYSLKVKVTSGMGEASSTVVQTPTVNNLTMITTISDTNGLDAYAVTTSSVAPADNSEEWISITDGTAKSNVIRTSTVTTKTIEYMVKKNGTYYLHVKNNLNEVKSKSFTANATGEKATTKIMNLAATNTNELRIDEHSATGTQDYASTDYRYFGANPNNYVWFNNELWRIIGAMDVDNGSGNVEKRLKIIRGKSIGSLYYYDDNWSYASYMSINTLLNSGDYYNRVSTYSSTGLTTEAKAMIGNAEWYIGPIYGGYPSASRCYDTERETSYTPWSGKVGLMNFSDYSYSTDMSGRCNTAATTSYDCSTNSWIHNNYKGSWVINPSIESGYIMYVNNSGYYDTSSSPYHDVLPVTYLNANVKILDGDGTTERPFVLSN